uniref:ATP synthase complex subunit 8 n=1 Tax=Cosmoscarta dorsimacula TaxID=797793 RepID=A0A3Q8RZ95_9HEMI|nr:ATP synthase F0 subunit 8 [Cosmoscarta dorsimacula]AZJ53293.1 ATP synthase F0 subunit 8 [Cosmoscarta dorsimacula]
MPQMAPMWWTMLFLMFNLTFLLLNMLMYFIINFNNKMKFNKMMKNQMIWKW